MLIDPITTLTIKAEYEAKRSRESDKVAERLILPFRELRKIASQKGVKYVRIYSEMGKWTFSRTKLEAILHNVRKLSPNVYVSRSPDGAYAYIDYQSPNSKGFFALRNDACTWSGATYVDVRVNTDC